MRRGARATAGGGSCQRRKRRAGGGSCQRRKRSCRRRKPAAAEADFEACSARWAEARFARARSGGNCSAGACSGGSCWEGARSGGSCCRGRHSGGSCWGPGRISGATNTFGKPPHTPLPNAPCVFALLLLQSLSHAGRFLLVVQQEPCSAQRGRAQRGRATFAQNAVALGQRQVVALK